MLHLLKIDLKKLTSYRTFWVVCGMYFVTLATVTSSGMEFVKFIARKGADFGTIINVARIPFYHFPDIWQNIIWASGLLKFVLGIMVVISITNEFTYRTIRQNIIDGMSRWQFLQSKILTNVLLSLMSTVVVSIIGLITGLIYSPSVEMADILAGLEFFPGYFLEVFAYLSYALMFGILIQRSGLTILMVLLWQIIESIIKAKVPEFIKPFFPMEAISNLVRFPLMRYLLQEIQDYVAWSSVAIVTVWIFLFNYFSYLKLTKSDI